MMRFMTRLLQPSPKSLAFFVIEQATADLRGSATNYEFLFVGLLVGSALLGSTPKPGGGDTVPVPLRIRIPSLG